MSVFQILTVSNFLILNLFSVSISLKIGIAAPGLYPDCAGVVKSGMCRPLNTKDEKLCAGKSVVDKKSCDKYPKQCGWCDPKKVSAKGDPKAVNIHGEKFDIQRLGTFTFLRFAQATQTLMNLDATVGRAGPTCDHTYILNLTLTGSWLGSKLSIRAPPHAPPLGAREHKKMEVLYNNEWQRFVQLKNDMANISNLLNLEEGALILKVHGVRLKISVDAHRIQKTSTYANFLDLEVNGLNQFTKQQNIILSGLLAYDDHAFAEQAPDDCDNAQKRSLKVVNTDISQYAMMSVLNVID